MPRGALFFCNAEMRSVDQAVCRSAQWNLDNFKKSLKHALLMIVDSYVSEDAARARQAHLNVELATAIRRRLAKLLASRPKTNASV